MMTDNKQVATTNSGGAVVEHAPATQIFSPLDVSPEQFKMLLDQRSVNYDALAQHLRTNLVHGKDFGRIHIANKRKCPKPWQCTYEQNRGHYSGYTLFSSGADKVLGTLGLGVSYPDEQDYRRAALTGKAITDIIIKAFVIDGHGQSICEGMGAAGLEEHDGKLNNALKKALKRARLDAVMRIPSVSALFESDFLAEIAKTGSANTVNSRSRTTNPARSSGAELEIMPFGPFKDERFVDLPDSQLDWCIHECKNADVARAARKEQKRRLGQATTNGAAKPEAPCNEEPPPIGEGDFDDDIPF